MSWQLDMRSAEAMANASRIPSSLEIITLIKKVNPTKLLLSESDRERGYEVKGKLQNLLLENYGEAFYLAPHPFSENVILIKHKALPSIDACHADLKSLSLKALEVVAEAASKTPENKAAKRPRKDDKQEATGGCSPREALTNALKLLEEYEYAGAEALLAGIRITAVDQLATLEKAARLLVEELGAYERAIETLLAQPRQIIREKSIRELLALTYYHNGMLPEARALFDSVHPDEFGKNALFAYADLSFKDGNLSHAYNLLGMADQMEGYVTGAARLRKDIEASMQAEAEPVLQRALAAWDRGEVTVADSLAREALEHYPLHRKARKIVAQIGSSRLTHEIAELWEKFALAVKREEKNDLLGRLLDRDKDNKERIKELMAEEKESQKKELVDRRVDDLRRLADEANWKECYAILHWLSGQEGCCEQYREACSISAYFSVLYRNRRLRMLPARASEELWLDFVKAKSSLQSGRQKGCFEIMEGIKQYFEAYPEFSEDYLMLLRIEQERAREEIPRLLLKIEAEACSVSQANRVFACIRKTMAVLPAEERSEFGRMMEARLALLKPDHTEDVLLEAYLDALLSGNAPRAALLREDFSDKTPLEKIDAEIADLFRIESQPVTLTLSDDLPVDLSSEPPLIWSSSTDRHIVFIEELGSIVIVNLEQMTATRFTSANFKCLLMCDAIPDKDTFLFRELEQALDTVWRAELSSGRSAFTAVFGLQEKFSLKEGDFIAGIYLSSEKATDYYVNVINKEASTPGKMMKQRLGNKNGGGESIRIDNQPRLHSWRASSQPDRFIIGAEDETLMCNRSLKSEVGVTMTPEIWAVDEACGHIYYFYSCMLKRVDFQFENYEEFPQSCCSFFMRKHVKLGLCPAEDTVMVGLRGKSAFYNYRSNKISNPFRRGRVICTTPARKWYCFDYCKNSLELTLRDITSEIGALLEWEEAKWEDSDQADELHKQVYFGYQATEEEESQAPGGGGPP